MKAGVIWKQGMDFNGFNDKNDAENFITVPGPSPKHLFLQSIAGCTAMDVIFILEKMKVEMPSKFTVSVDADVTETHPKVFTNFLMIYHVEGNIDPEKIKRAVKLSQDTYCGVSTMARKIAPFDVKIELNGSEI
ncbi:MAG TPA: OsmC family protein [bacterium]|nr:OsmC family protein [bacterium]HPS29316.1 OsmC family protein [bacterium]